MQPKSSVKLSDQKHGYGEVAVQDKNAISSNLPVLQTLELPEAFGKGYIFFIFSNLQQTCLNELTQSAVGTVILHPLQYILVRNLIALAIH